MRFQIVNCDFFQLIEEKSHRGIDFAEEKDLR